MRDDAPESLASATTPRRRDVVSELDGSPSPAGTTKPKPVRGEPEPREISPVEAERPSPKHGSKRLTIAATAVAVVVVTVIGATLAGGGETARPPVVTAANVDGEVVNPGAVNALALDPVENLVGRRDGDSAMFEWDHEGRVGMDYVVRRVDGADTGPSTVDEPSVVIAGIDDGETPCILVIARIEGVAQSEPSGPVCATG